ncbi:MAG: hypothetical protein JSS07_01590 [Proteobacteria bacterium]|nr:hypothetical protein [Pseudomonadota bacterium]
MKLIAKKNLALISAGGGLSQDDILDLSALYGCMIGTFSGMNVGGVLGYANHIWLTPIGIITGGVLGMSFGIASGILYGVALSGWGSSN